MSVLAAAATVPLMASYGYVASLPFVMVMAIPHGVMEAIQSPGTQAAVADAARRDDAAAAQGLAEAAGSAAAAIGAFTAAPLFDALGAGPAWLIAGVVMTGAAGRRARCSTARASPAGRVDGAALAGAGRAAPT